jgi:hypothetical protein
VRGRQGQQGQGGQPRRDMASVRVIDGKQFTVTEIRGAKRRTAKRGRKVTRFTMSPQNAAYQPGFPTSSR